MPDFFILGHPKCGTTALYEMLRRHPQIFMPALKEPAYFATDLRSRFQRKASGQLPVTLEQYLSLFDAAAPAQLVGEASSSYLVSTTAARGIAELQPGARLIAILREPASFLRSLHLQLLQNHIESERDLRRALALEPARRQGRQIPRRSPRPQALLYSERVRYVEQLRRYRAVFAEEQLLVLIYDDFRAENEATVGRVLRFLEVDPTVPVEPSEVNPTVRMRSQRLDELVHTLTVGDSPLARARAGAGEGAGATAAAPRRAARRPPPLRGRRAAAARRGVDVGVAPAVRAGGGGVERVPRPRSREPVGL